ncbi:MAG TPA: Mth938-like domain-containing protein [Sphingomonadaceae bacterium]|nr:Mth938-like domain-containing protein [Sphingomonadaceae bacterium]
MPARTGPMMQREPAPSGPVVTGFSGTGFKIGDTLYPTGLWITPSEAHSWDAPAFDELNAATFAPFLALSPPPEFLLLGTGATMRALPAALRQAIEAGGVGVEAMDSRAAARAWGVLRGEGRWIVAALMPL